ncbi:MAG: FAD-binding oxidoreductase [Gammaproteobacteria bacterium]|nr:FAD-binding oxidoreductase [Gammaproteobacteria bacterium]
MQNRTKTPFPKKKPNSSSIIHNDYTAQIPRIPLGINRLHPQSSTSTVPIKEMLKHSSTTTGFIKSTVMHSSAKETLSALPISLSTSQKLTSIPTVLPLSLELSLPISLPSAQKVTSIPICLSHHDITDIPKARPYSFWDKPLLTHDCIIIGGGIVGLSTAISFKESVPNAKVLVLESGILPTGASSRNAGFTCFGSLSEILNDIQKMGEEKAIAQVRDRWEGLKLLREFLGDSAIGFRQPGNYELLTEDLLSQLKHLERINTLLYPIFGDDVFIRTDEDIDKFGFSKKHVKALILNQFEGELDSGKMMEALRTKAQSLNIVIRYGSHALRPRNIPNGIEIPVQHKGGIVPFHAKVAAVCINGYTNDLFPEYDIKPGRGQIFVTKPMKHPLRFKAPCHLGAGFWYFRPLEGNRILLGGGRHLNFSQETTTNRTTTADIMGPLKAILQQIIVPSDTPIIEHTWAGVMGFSSDHQPKIEVIPGHPGLIIGFGCNGMGIARGFHTGQKTAALLRTQLAPHLKSFHSLENQSLENTTKERTFSVRSRL